MRAIVALVALLLLSGQGLDPLAPSNADKSSAAQPAPAVESVAGSPDPIGNLPANPPAAGSAPIGTVSPAEPQAAAPAKAKDKKAKTDTAAAGKPEVLPWEGKPLAPPAPADPKTAAASPCNSLIEASCREQKKTCAWIGDMKQGDGSVIPGRCAPRPAKKAQAPAAAKPKPKPKPAVDPAAAAAATAAPPADAATADTAAKPAPASPVTITVNPPAGNPPAVPADPAAAEGIPQPAPE